MKKGWNKKKFKLKNYEKEPVPIISDAMIATKGIGDGRGIPLIIIDTSLRSDFEQLVKAHKHINLGDVKTVWSKPSKNKDMINLMLFFKKPSEVVLILEFDMPRKSMIVDKIVQSQALYIQPGSEGDRIGNTMDNPRILVEVQSRQFRKEWNKILNKVIQKDLRLRGVKRKYLKEASKEVIKEWRSLDYFRMK